MRILMAVTSMTTGGIQSTVTTLAEELAAHGHVVGIVSLCGTDEVATSSAIRRWSLGLPGLGGTNVLTATKRLRSILRDWEPDIVHSHAIHANLVSRCALTYRGRPSHVATLHSVQEGGRAHGLLAKALNLVLDRTVSVSRAVANAHGMPAGAPIVHNAIDLDMFMFDSQARTECRQALGILDSQTLAISVGRLTAAKDFPTLIDAVRRSSQGLPLVVVVAGSGPLRDELVALVERHGVGDRIHFLGLRKDIPQLLSAADVYVQSSAWEGFPVAPLEAMAAGLPVIATNVGGTAELAPPPDVMVDAGDVDGLATALDGSPSLRRTAEFRSSAADRLRHYSVKTWVSAWLVQYESVSGS